MGLGGKNPVIVDETANVYKAARQMLSSRTINCGQMCISPDYVLCHEDKMDEFVKAIKETATKWFSTKEDCDKCVGKIVSSQQFDRVTKMIKATKGEIIFGGDFDEKTSYIQPTVIRVDDWEDYGMKQETFGPVLWIAPAIKNVQQAVDYINTRDKSLSLYMFSENRLRYSVTRSQCARVWERARAGIRHV